MKFVFTKDGKREATAQEIATAQDMGFEIAETPDKKIKTIEKRLSAIEDILGL